MLDLVTVLDEIFSLFKSQLLI